MVSLNREQVIAIAAVSFFVLLCGASVGVSFQSYFEASQELKDKRELLVRLEVAPRSRTDTRGGSISAIAPASAFLGGPTQGLAGAQLQSYIASLATDQHATLLSSGVDSAREDSPDLIRVQAMMDIPSARLQGFLFQLEMGVPYVFVESIKVVPASIAAQGAILDATLRVTLTLRALWRRDAA
jgi:general secretion pathway protein M